jgi:hypothetical protein
MKAYPVEIEHRETDQVFSYYHNLMDGTNAVSLLHFNASLLARLHQQMKPEFRRITMDIGQAGYDLCMKHRGIEEAKVERLTPSQLRDPGYGALFPDGSFTIVDGHHRLVRRYRGGVRVMDFWVCLREVWQHCLIEYTPEGECLIREALPPRVEDPAMIPSTVKVHKP